VPENVSLTVGDFSAELRNLVLPMGLNLALVTLKGAGLSWQREPFQINVEEPGAFEAHVTQDDITAFLNKQAPAGLKNFKVEVSEGKLNLDASMKMVFDVPARAVCTLKIVDETKLFVELESVEILGAGAKNLVKSQLDKINPVMDATEFPVHALLSEVVAENGEIVVRGTVSPKL
jgi:hypothetical protein